MSRSFHRGRLAAAAVAACALISSCASTTMPSNRLAKNYGEVHVHKVLIVSIMSTPQTRRWVEEEIARQWMKRDVDAIASSAVLPPGVRLDKAGIAPYARMEGFDSVLVSRFLKRPDAATQTLVPALEDRAVVLQGEARLSEHIRDVVASAEYGPDYEVVAVGTNLYDAATERLLWSDVSPPLAVDEFPRRAGFLIQGLLQDLYPQRSL